MTNWPKNLTVAVLGCSVAVVVLVGFVLAGLWRVSVSIDTQGDLLEGQVRSQDVQSCTTAYAATYSAWDARANSLFGALIAASAAAPEGSEPDPRQLRAYTTATDNADEMTGRRLGLASLTVPNGEPFDCPPIPARLRIDPLDPTDPDPP